MLMNRRELLSTIGGAAIVAGTATVTNGSRWTHHIKLGAGDAGAHAARAWLNDKEVTGHCRYADTEEGYVELIETEPTFHIIKVTGEVKVSIDGKMYPH